MTRACGRCSKEISCAVFICYEVNGDEYMNDYFLCLGCDAYTLEVTHDRFLGESHSNTHDMSRQAGDALVELIRGCPDPTDKRCPCPVHAKFA